MTNGHATSPQQQTLKNLADTIATRDPKNIEPLLAKDFTFTTFPKTAELPDLTKEGYLQKYGAAFPGFAKIEVGTIRLLRVRTLVPKTLSLPTMK